MALTDEQERKIRLNRKQTLPDFYSSELGSVTSISTDTEGALILLGSSTKNEAIQYLKAFAAAQESALTQDYNDLLGEFAAQQITNSNAIQADLQQVTGKFNTFRAKFVDDVDGADDVIIRDGLQPMLQAMTTTAGRMIEIDRAEVYHATFDSIVDAQFRQAINSDAKRELRSWVRVLASYP